MALGMFAFFLIFAGHFAFFTYLRPFLEQVTAAGSLALTMVLLVFGLGTFLGNTISSAFITHSLTVAQVSMPLLLATLSVLFIFGGGHLVTDAAMAGIWGMAFGVIPVSWSTWVTRIVPDEAESGGGLMVATANFAITASAGIGGFIFNGFGSLGIFVACTIALIGGAICALNVRQKWD